MTMRLSTVLISLLAACGVCASMAIAADTGRTDGKGRFAALDANADGFIDRSEAKGRLARRFDRLDADRDGRISHDEIKAGRKARHKAGHAGFHRGAGLTRFDADTDNKVTWAEYSAAAKMRFDRIDTNKNGVIDTSEMEARKKHWRAAKEAPKT